MPRLAPWLIVLGACAQPAELPPEYPPLEAVAAPSEQPEAPGDAQPTAEAPADAGTAVSPPSPPRGDAAMPASDAGKPAMPVAADAG